MKQVEITNAKNGFGMALADAADSDSRIVGLGLDITNSVGMNFFKERHPERFFSLGIAEQNAAATAAGLALSGKVPAFSTYAVFSALRCIDQIRVSVCYNNLHVIVGGAHAGISVGADGATHQALEDLAIMRAMPNMTVLSPCDENQTYLATMAAIKDLNSPCYIRYGREPVPNFTSRDDKFEIGKAQWFKHGSDLGIVATGSMVWTALETAEILESKGFSVGVLNIHTLKPIDKDAIIQIAKESRRIITLEEHQVIGGLGGAVAEVLGEHCPTPIKIIGMPDCFGESGSPKELLKKYGLDSQSVSCKAMDFINK
ncbi:MAG: transketolase family protein [Bacteroidales bacterium]|nr:transketolase family protein [Bacteroidales bacterium]